MSISFFVKDLKVKWQTKNVYNMRICLRAFSFYIICCSLGATQCPHGQGEGGIDQKADKHGQGEGGG